MNRTERCIEGTHSMDSFKRCSEIAPMVAKRCVRLPLPFVVLAVLLVTGCAVHTGHTVDPYGQQPTKALEIEQLAITECRGNHHGQQPPFSFTTDGCSLWPDSVWVRCCVIHDRAYWCGGSFRERMEADRQLRSCVADSGHSVVAFLMRGAVLVGGTQYLPTSFRWGYGWPYPSSASAD